MKFFAVVIAVLSFQALSTEGWRRCFELTDPPPTTEPPPTTTTEPPPPPPPDTTTTEPPTPPPPTTEAPTSPPPDTTTTEAPTPPPETTTTEAPTPPPDTTTTEAPTPPPSDTTTTEPPTPPPDTTTTLPDTTTTITKTTTTTEATTTPTPTPPPGVYECAVWTRYNEDLAPETNGFSAGISAVSNTQAYVGFGMYVDRRLPGRIQTTTVGTKGPGSYVPWGDEIKVKYPEYLLLPQNCTCEWLPPATAVTLAGVIYTGDPYFMYAVGRKTFADGRVAISRVITNPAPAFNPTRFNQAYINGAGNEITNDNPATELLVCRSPIPPTGRPIITFPTEACGVWSTIGMTNYVSTNGFNAGISRVNNIAWVGRGQHNAYYSAGRYQDEAVTGTYSSWAGDKLADYGSAWLIVPQGCYCSWMAPNLAKIRKGLVTAPDDNFNFMIGRVKLSTTQVSVSRVRFFNGWEVYNKLTDVDGYRWATEVLVCETTPPPPQQCALWMRYNDDNGPEVNGISAGISVINNSTAYVGRGVYGTLRVPARIQTTTVGARTPGAYLAVVGEYKARYYEYLVVQSGCTCSFQPKSFASGRLGLVFTGDPVYEFAVGRKTFVDGRVAISRAHFALDVPGLYDKQAYINGAGVEIYEETTDLLVCETTESTANAPVINFVSEACGVWSSINMIESVQANGFSAGISRLNDEAYIGRGQQDGQFQPGRYDLNGTVGVYTAWSSDRITKFPEWLVISEGCTCRWMTPNAAKARKGLLVVPDDVYGFMVGRKKFSTGQVSVSRVSYVWLDQWYTNLNNHLVIDKASELLVCENVPPPPEACALWTRFNNDDGPAINGFVAGTAAITNTTNYVGYGTRGSFRVPARIQLTDTNFNGRAKTIGAWVSAAAETRANYAEYLVVAEGCTCSWQPWSLASSRPGLVLTGDVYDMYAVGRKTFSPSGLISISRVVTDSTDVTNYGKQFYNDGTGLQVNEPATEVLVCETTESTAVPPRFTLKDESCGVWSGINMVNSVTSNGFLVGPSRTGELAFVGRGHQGAEFQVGRYQDNSTTGTYTASGSDQLAQSSQWLIVPEGCTCKWMDPWVARIRKGVVTAPDDLYNFMVGRVNLTSTTVSVSRVGYTSFTQYYSNINNVLNSDQATLVLVCENIPDPPPGCAVWARYNYDNEPANVGFAAGTASDGSTAYVGFGNYIDQTYPGRVKLGTGVYVPSFGDQLVNYPEYLVVPQNCECKWMPPHIASNRPGFVQVSDRNNFYAVGRVQLSATQIAISRVYTRPLANYYEQIWTSAAGTQPLSTPATEVLVCESTAPETASQRPVINFQGEACGVWSLINTGNYVTTQGFYVGPNSVANTDIYVGRGIYIAEFEAGRYQNEDSQTYVAYGAEQKTSTSEYLIVPQGCRCRWMDRWAAWIRRGTVTASDHTFNFMVGRVNLTSGQTSISRVRGHWKTNFEQWYATSTTTSTSNLNTEEILSCDNLPDAPPNPCALWLRYVGDAAPATNGFDAGISAYNSAANSTAWLARAYRVSWLMPGRVQITGTTGQIWLTGHGEGRINQEATPTLGGQEYLVVRDGCTCSWMHPSIASNHAGLVRTSEQYVDHDFVPFRQRYADGRVSIGRTSMSEIWGFKTWYTLPDGNQVELDTAAQVRDIKEWLVCESDQDMSVKPTITNGFGNKACGLWARYTGNDWPATHGFAFGLDRFNNTSYVGRANVFDNIWNGRLQLTGTRGVYTSTGGETLGEQPEYLVVPNGCNCAWETYATSKNKVGVVRSIEYDFPYAVGRKSISATQWAISSINTDTNFQRWVNVNGDYSTDSAPTEILVCETP